MAGHYIEDIPPTHRKELEHLLDSHPTLNWRALIHHIPNRWYQNYQIEGFGMKTLEPGGSPTNALLNDLSLRHVTIQQLVFWLYQLASQGHFPKLKLLISKLEGREPLTITRQPDELYRHTIGSSVYIKCETCPSTGVNYQWFKRKELLQGKTHPLLHLQNITKNDESFYTCRVSLDVQNCLFTDWAKLEILESLPEMAKPRITTHPCCPEQAILGGILYLYCDAVGDPAPKFQWYKDSMLIPGATDRDYNKANLCHDDEGVYQCVASNSAGEAFSNRTDVKVCKRQMDSHRQPGLHGRNPGPENNPFYSPIRVSDKVALLIGNKEYINPNLGPLYHPTNDVCDLAGALTSIGFKVVSLVNLTLSEMKFAVKQFYEMLDENMYALFYFAGHGFEVDNQSYLMPVDASPKYLPEENLSATEVISRMQSSQAYLNIVLLDSCRTQPKRNIVNNPNDGLVVKKKNVMIVFPCCSKNSVFESESHTNGYFAYYLLKHIGDDVNVSEIMLRVSEGIDKEDIRDPNTEQKQIVYRNSTIAEQLSLKAPIDQTAPIKRSSERWKAAHEIPQNPVVVFKEGDCTVELLFFAEFSNVLLVHARLNGDNSQHSFILEPDIQIKRPTERNGCIYERINEKDPTVPHNFPLANCLFQAIRIKDLQRLKGDLVIDIEFHMASQRDNRRIKYTMETKPLYAKIVQPL